MAAIFKGLYLAAARSQACKLPFVGSYRVRTVESFFLGCGWRTQPQASLPAFPRLLLLPAPAPVPAPVSALPSLDELLGPLDWDDEFEALSERDPPAEATSRPSTSSAEAAAAPAEETAIPSPPVVDTPVPRVIDHHNFLGEPVYYPTWNPDEVTEWAIQLAHQHQGEGLAPLAHHGRPSMRLELLKNLSRWTVGWWSIDDYQAYLVEMAAWQSQISQHQIGAA